MMRKISPTDERFMRAALRLAERGTGTVSPNPLVGAVIVKSGKIIGRGWHQKAGLAHAEVNAVQDAKSRGANCVGATLYVTLEPCSSHGRTPPCTDLIKRGQFARVVVGCLDPDDRHQGRGCKLLRETGIKVDVGCLEEDCLLMNRVFFTGKLLRRPWFTGKIALTRDGKASGQPRKWISSTASRRHAHGLRFAHDAILVGAGTVRADDPALTLRHGYAKDGKDQPWRVILAGRSKLPPDARVFTDEYRDRTILITPEKCKSPSAGRLKPEQIARFLYDKGIFSCLIEGGVEVLDSFFKAGLIDEFHLYQSQTVLSKKKNALDAGKLLRRLEGRGFEKTGESRRMTDRVSHYFSSSSGKLLRTISSIRR
ncbi:bifunctional diaminohydroxyphosphoribosylaminopyrimidine deaminase/5-amino-6-(5-phosphoribosylamino)uracil reductase RibD [Oscillatoria amoena NRMC-F 0135]|nr:bifunctional diaminohydroxyphosphoribosylaminopyrimidine deaminase/5-amino-6-(5-phosphoribosylamino)uracil reductase RibD [Oscillatoria laete-virens]MDL5049112.1 bifunctional diaminohydroxyphosphoribosylaminopyrimidine deaminase/5-amino-6-(5-phosphoribosylamino)uracil reductase RibD [Oscillatoria amoena NRMC-F 0135]MDL5054004.1 bifunctional diaminohydroxyphosphoribosylaminopyrimidine deaminase/5-amino-6-(5-phosphoribosylamino)uracil reductase RibD [Oscillatoria laete-virens NRMC-F 0139]